MNSEIVLEEIDISKQSIKKLGSRLRKKSYDESDINLLHDYRVWFKEPMSNVFKIVGDVKGNLWK